MNARSLLASAGVLGAVLLAGCPKPPEPVEPPAAPEVVEFKASKTEASPKETITLSWSVRNADTLSLEQLTVGPIAQAPEADGQQDVTLGDSDAVFVLTARNKVGTDSLAIRVKVGGREQLVLLAAVPERIQAGASTTLVYSSPTADGLKLLDAAGAPVAIGTGATGSVQVSPRFDAAYTFEAAGQIASAKVAVTPGIVALEASHVADEPGKIRVRWSAGGADALKLAAAGRGELFQSTSHGIIAEGSFDDTLPSTLTPDSQVAYTLTVGEGDAAVQRTVTIRAGGTPAIDSFTAPTWARANGQVPLQWKTRGAVRVTVWQGTTQLFEASSEPLLREGVFFVNTPTEPTTYELRAFDANGNESRAQASTEPVGDVALVNFTADKNALATGGERVKLEWKVANARRMRIEATGLHLIHEAEGRDAEEGFVYVYPNAASVIYVLTADNTVGSALSPQTQTVTVTSPISGVKTWPEQAPAGAVNIFSEAQVASNELGAVAYEGFPNVVKNAPGDGFVDIREFGTEVPFPQNADAQNVKIGLPETFTVVHYGQRKPDLAWLNVSLNGWMSLGKTQYASGFGSTGPDDNIVGMPAGALDYNAMAAWFADLRMTPEGKVQFATVGLGPDRRLVVQWSDLELEGAPGSRVTFQVQVFNSGRITYAYGKLDGVAGATPTIGVQNENKTLAVLAPDLPVSGDAYTFFGPTQTPAPFPIYITTTPYLARLRMQDGGFMEINARPPTMPKDLFYVSEVNFAAASGVVDGEWIELTSRHTAPINLRGFSIDFGPGRRHRIESDLILPAGGQLLLAQSQGAGDGLAVDYVYGPTWSMDDLNGKLSINAGDLAYTELAWAFGEHNGPGASYRKELKQPAPWLYDSSATGVTCPGVTAYGTHGQLGTPKLPDVGCFPYVMSSTGAPFESIRATGTLIPVQQARGDVGSITLPFPVRVGHRTATTLYVASNGFITLDPLPCGVTSSGCYYSNDSSPRPTSEPNGAIAVFWDSLNFASAGRGIYWEARDPDGIPGNDDDYVLVSWENVALFDSSKAFECDLNFQVLLTATGTIEYRYGTMIASGTTNAANQAKGSSASIWLEEPTGNGAIKVNVNSASPGISPNTSYRFTWSP